MINTWDRGTWVSTEHTGGTEFEILALEPFVIGGLLPEDKPAGKRKPITKAERRKRTTKKRHAKKSRRRL